MKYEKQEALQFCKRKATGDRRILMLYCLMVASIMIFSGACADKPNHKLMTVDVEVNPGQFIAIGQSDETATLWETVMMSASESTYLLIPWKGKMVRWHGLTVPVSLREYHGRLYMIGFDRETEKEKCRFVYYRQENSSLIPIKPEEYPKQIAIENMWLGNKSEAEIESIISA